LNDDNFVKVEAFYKTGAARAIANGILACAELGPGLFRPHNVRLGITAHVRMENA
jgi:hypothetical protein